MKNKGFFERIERVLMNGEISEFCFLNLILFTSLIRKLTQIQNIKKSTKNLDFSSISPFPAGLGIGIDRLLTIILNKRSIQDIIYFPFVKRK